MPGDATRGATTRNSAGAPTPEDAVEWPTGWKPKQVIWVDRMPLLPNGKVDRQALVAMVLEGSP